MKHDILPKATLPNVILPDERVLIDLELAGVPVAHSLEPWLVPG